MFNVDFRFIDPNSFLLIPVPALIRADNLYLSDYLINVFLSIKCRDRDCVSLDLLDYLLQPFIKVLINIDSTKKNQTKNISFATSTARTTKL